MTAPIRPAPPKSVVSLIDLCEKGWVPDALTRLGMRMLMQNRLREVGQGGEEGAVSRLTAMVRELEASPIAIATASANQQHYEVPAAFFHAHLGPCLKYSSCLYPSGRETLEAAEIAMLELTAARAGLADGQRILDLGCGWGSLSLWMAERFPHASITGISNSHGQREFIMAKAQAKGLTNVKIITADIVDFDFDEDTQDAGFDRITSIEMLEHMKNYRALFAKISRWLKPEGRLFVHVFAHRQYTYHFNDEDESDWMTRYFFTGGLMPSRDLFLCFPEHLAVTDQWWVDGRHYEKTANHWLAGMDHAKTDIMAVFKDTYGADAAIWFQRWRMFYMAVAELFGYRNGSQWGVAHYLFKPTAAGLLKPGTYRKAVEMRPAAR